MYKVFETNFLNLSQAYYESSEKGDQLFSHLMNLSNLKPSKLKLNVS
jgi:hypothetical protein